MKSAFLRVALLLGLLTPLAQADPNIGFTAFAGQDLGQLADGKVLQARGGLIDFERGLTAQALFFVEAPPETVLQKIGSWDPASHSELDVWLHAALPLNPTLNDFSKLSTLPDNKSVNNMVAATYGYSAGSDSLQLNAQEGAIVAAGHGQTQSKEFIVDVWSKILHGRVSDYLSGSLANARYVSKGDNVSPISDAKALLRSDPKVFNEFHPMLSGTPVYNANKTKPNQLYYECFDIEGTASFGTGAVYLASSPATIQRADVEYFVSSGIYASVELEQLWPVTIGGKNGTLVWRTDMVSVPNVAYLHGTERLASGMLMLQDVKQAIDAFRTELK